MILIERVIVDNCGTELGLLFRVSQDECDTLGHTLIIERHVDSALLQIIALLLIQLNQEFNELLGLCLVTLGQVVDDKVLGEVLIKLGGVRSHSWVVNLVDIVSTS
jgi:hypothetical protein